MLVFLPALKLGGFCWVFFVCVFSPLLQKYSNLIIWWLQFQEFFQLLPKGQLSWRTEEWQIWKMCPFPMEKTKTKYLSLLHWKTMYFYLPKHVTWTKCAHSALSCLLSGYCSHLQSGRAAFCYDMCFIWINSQKSLGENTRAYALSTRQCPTRKFRYTSVLLAQSSSAFQFCRQLRSSEFSAFFLKVNGVVHLYLIEFKSKSYFIQIIFSLYIPLCFPSADCLTIQNLQSKLFYILVFFFSSEI